MGTNERQFKSTPLRSVRPDKPRVLLRVQNKPPTHFVLKSNFLL